MRRPQACSEPGDGTIPLPDLSQLSISPQTPSLLLGDGQVQPESPYPLTASLPDTSLPATPLPARSRRSHRAESSSALPTINVVVRATHASISINDRAPVSPRKGARTNRAQPAATSPTPAMRSAAAQTPPPPPYTIRGGGKVIAWNAALEHIEPRDPRHTRKWYVVTAGLRVGIWKSWLAMEDYVDVEGKRFQSYARREDAEKDYYDAKHEGRVRLLIR